MTMLPCCPTCGNALQVRLGVAYYEEKHELVSSEYSVTFTGKEAQLFELLWKNRSRGFVSKTAMHDHLYGDDPNGGPLDKIIEVYISKLRKKLAEKGADIAIETKYDCGYRLTTCARKVTA